MSQFPAAGPLLAAHGDGALGPVDRAAVQGHLASGDDGRDLAVTASRYTGTVAPEPAAAERTATWRRPRRDASEWCARLLGWDRIPPR